jgi:phosphoribosylamine--glycine ligase
LKAPNARTRAKKPAKLAGHQIPVMVMGVGAFAQSTAQILKENGTEVYTYLTRNYGEYSPSLAGPVYRREEFTSPCRLIQEKKIGLVVPMSIDWAQAPWKDELLSSGTPIFCPTGEGMRIERERDFARELCQRFKVPYPEAHVASNRLEAEAVLKKHQRAFVIKNPLCSPTSPIHTIICQSPEDTRSWLKQIDYAEGVFLQEYLGPSEAGHIALVSGGEIYSLVTNQEYKRAFAGNMGIVAGAPLGGLVELDPQDKYGLASALIHPLLPWFREVNYHGPIQVTAVQRNGCWHVIEYNIRIGVTSGAMILRMLANPIETLLGTARNQKLYPKFHLNRDFGCSVTLAGYGYPYVQVRGPHLPVELDGTVDCDIWWNEVTQNGDGIMVSTGHRIADVIAFGISLAEARENVYRNIQKIRSLGSYYREDIGQTLWPPGNGSKL